MPSKEPNLYRKCYKVSDRESKCVKSNSDLGYLYIANDDKCEFDRF